MGSKGNGSITSKGVEAGLAVNITLLLKWDPIENRFFFNQLMVVFAAELEFSYTVYLTPCPIFYCSVSIGLRPRSRRRFGGQPGQGHGPPPQT